MRGICFKEDMFRAVVNGNKTHTRRMQPVRYNYDETLYLKEPYYCAPDGDIYHKYNFKDTEPVNFIQYKEEGLKPKWKNKLFMPESAARYFIKITKVHLEQLQEITKADCVKEGIINSRPFGFRFNDFLQFKTARAAFSCLWDLINGEGSWNKNPVVCVYEFKLLK